MLSNPKWVQFYVIFFMIAHIVGYMMNNQYMISQVKPMDTWSFMAFLKAMTFSYDWIQGDLVIFARILNAIELTGVVLIGWDLVGGIFGRKV